MRSGDTTAGILLRHLNRLELAQKITTCKRKGVGCCLLDYKYLEETGINTINGPAMHLQSVCTGEVGKCGCPHAEPRAIIQALKMSRSLSSELVIVSSFSPCNQCADLICLCGIIKAVVYDIFAPHHPQACDAIRNQGIKVIEGKTLRECLYHGDLKAKQLIEESFLS